jgi:uncharacterized protein
MARPSPEQLVEFWNLRTMPTENVRFWQSYVDDKIGPDGKPLCSAIVALLVDDPSVFSDMHRLPTDEIWHFYLGDPIELLLLHLGRPLPGRRTSHRRSSPSSTTAAPMSPNSLGCCR